MIVFGFVAEAKKVPDANDANFCCCGMLQRFSSLVLTLSVSMSPCSSPSRVAIGLLEKHLMLGRLLLM